MALTLDQDGAEPWHQQSAGTDHIDEADLAGSCFLITEIDPIGALQAAMEGYQVTLFVHR